MFFSVANDWHVQLFLFLELFSHGRLLMLLGQTAFGIDECIVKSLVLHIVCRRYVLVCMGVCARRFRLGIGIYIDNETLFGLFRFLNVSYALFDAQVDFHGATRIYRTCRRSGVTPRGMIAAVALRSGASLLTADSDLDHVARVMRIDLDVT